MYIFNELTRSEKQEKIAIPHEKSSFILGIISLSSFFVFATVFAMTSIIMNELSIGKLIYIFPDSILFIAIIISIIGLSEFKKAKRIFYLDKKAYLTKSKVRLWIGMGLNISGLIINAIYFLFFVMFSLLI